MITALKKGTDLAAGIDHPAYDHRIDAVAENIRSALIKDLD